MNPFIIHEFCGDQFAVLNYEAQIDRYDWQDVPTAALILISADKVLTINYCLN